jgi:ABC-type sugar transport system ATPase subunit
MMTPARDHGGTEPVALELRRIHKSFGVVQALGGVDLVLHGGEVHALVGENGAGKSTLIQIMSGVYRPDDGQIVIGGVFVHFSGPLEAETAGVSVVYQELSLIPELDVAQNVYLHREPRRLGGVVLDRGTLYRRCDALLAEVGIDVDPRARVRDLSVAQRQLVEIVKALSRDADFVVLDEPTASLTSVEQDLLFTVIRRLRAAGKAILYVSHRLEEIFEIADMVTVLKDGVLVRTMPIGETDQHDLVRLMVGRELADDLFPARRPARPTRVDPPLLSVDAVGSPVGIEAIAFGVWPGEVLGLAGLVGSGRTSVLRAVFGLDPDATGTVSVGGHRVGKSPRDAVGAGIAFVTEDRKLEGLALDLTNLANLSSTTLPGRFGFYADGRARELATEVAGQVDIDPRALDRPARMLSGGNQQKVVVGKWLAVKPRVLLCDEPTRGIDVGAKAEIYRILRSLADDGVAIVFASSELPEVLGLADRILVMREGRIVAEMDSMTATEESVMQAAAIERDAQEVL